MPDRMEKIPDRSELVRLLGADGAAAWETITAGIDRLYDMERTWNPGGKRWQYEYKYRRGGKTLCALYAKEGQAGLMMIFGEAERAKVEEIRSSLARETMKAYDEATVYRDGKWVMFPLDAARRTDYEKLLAVKRRPNRKEER